MFSVFLKPLVLLFPQEVLTHSVKIPGGQAALLGWVFSSSAPALDLFLK